VVTHRSTNQGQRQRVLTSVNVPHASHGRHRTNDINVLSRARICPMTVSGNVNRMFSTEIQVNVTGHDVKLNPHRVKLYQIYSVRSM